MRVMIIEDNDEDYEAFTRIFNRVSGARMTRCRNGKEAQEHLDRLRHAPSDDRPSVILLDLNMPEIDGRDMLAWIKGDPLLRTIPVVVFSTSSNPDDVTFCYNEGANGYMVKPVNFMRLEVSLRAFCDYWEHAMVLPAA